MYLTNYAPVALLSLMHNSYRFTATFVQLLIRHGFQNPDFMLEQYIKTMTGGFLPTDLNIYQPPSTMTSLIEKGIIYDIKMAAEPLGFDSLTQIKSKTC
jgi:hypothetical protein